MMLRRTLNGAPLVTKQRTFALDNREILDNDVNAFLAKISSYTYVNVTGFELSHTVTIAETNSIYGVLYTTTVVWQEYAE